MKEQAGSRPAGVVAKMGAVLTGIDSRQFPGSRCDRGGERYGVRVISKLSSA
jgi:hypothetical protein